jgi:hypothetical protein
MISLKARSCCVSTPLGNQGAEAVNHLLDVFPEDEQEVIRIYIHELVAQVVGVVDEGGIGRGEAVRGGPPGPSNDGRQHGRGKEYTAAPVPFFPQEPERDGDQEGNPGGAGQVGACAGESGE